jgi:HEPN domain-containing protein
MDSFINQYEILFNKAKSDLTAAGILYARFIEGNSELDLEVICFHLQQSAEKLMKSILSKKQIYYPKIHDLETILLLIIENGIAFKSDIELLIELNDYAVEGRYSIMNDDIESIQKYFLLLNEMEVETRRILIEE